MTLHDPTTVTADALGDDETAILNVIRRETTAFHNLDFDAWCACWVQDERTHDVYSSELSGLTPLRGFAAVAENMKFVMDNDLICRTVDYALSNIQISVGGDMAWATYDCTSTFPSGNSIDIFETRILERATDGWKIAFSLVALHHGQSGEAAIRVDKTGHVTWFSQHAAEKLKTHPILTVSAGRIRTRRPEWDKSLQAAIGAAGDYHGFFELQRLASETGTGLRYPLILGETDDGGVAAVHLTAKDGATYIALDESAAVARRLTAARAVNGLSDAQFRTASLIAEGHGLPRVAEEMGITVNTVRTHLNRLYEKTGVNAQTALVRLLLSVGQLRKD